DEQMESIKSAVKSPAVYYDSHPETASGVKRVAKEEEEELDGVDPKFERFIIIGTIVTAVALGLALIYLVINLSGVLDIFKGNKEEGVTPTPEGSPTPTTVLSPTPTVEGVGMKDVVNVIGYKLDDAIRTLQMISPGFSIISDKEEYSKEVPKGYVLDQYPPENVAIAEDGTIELTISAGPEPKKVPNVAYYTFEKAKRELSDAGFDAKASYEASTEYENGMVIRTEPSADEYLEEGGTITVIVSTGPDIILTDVPKLLGLSEEDAVAALAKAGLSNGKTTYTSSDKYAEGLVCFQNYSEGERVASGTKVDIALSTGPDMTPTPIPTPTPEPDDDPEPTTEPEEDPDEAEDPTPPPEPTPTPTPEPEPLYSYQATAVISDWPLGESDTAMLYITISQDGNEVDITKEESRLFAASDFPYYLDITLNEDDGFTEGMATISVWFNGEPYAGNYSVELKAVRIN
ncbi:MAG: PASTA domain-containing protein, partial [Lachnospiraceae bacterium]|nr:PASTA domain-containing protein [Lachnospiraceae bacterium]